MKLYLTRDTDTRLLGHYSFNSITLHVITLAIFIFQTLFFTHSRIIIARHIVSLAIFICWTCVWFTNLIIWVTPFIVCTIFIILAPYILPYTTIVRNCILPLTHNLLLVSHLKLSPWQSSFVVHCGLQMWSIRSHPSFGPLQSSFELQPKHYIIDLMQSEIVSYHWHIVFC